MQAKVFRCFAGKKVILQIIICLVLILIALVLGLALLHHMTRAFRVREDVKHLYLYAGYYAQTHDQKFAPDLETLIAFHAQNGAISISPSNLIWRNVVYPGTAKTMDDNPPTLLLEKRVPKLGTFCVYSDGTQEDKED
jgi:hypothetical protein